MAHFHDVILCKLNVLLCEYDFIINLCFRPIRELCDFCTLNVAKHIYNIFLHGTFNTWVLLQAQIMMYNCASLFKMSNLTASVLS